eukprot:CAMPEP_0113879142 /NCGR_PEP_ID=MMETSP0780_2-20120614/7071_1 /TAXON_ID=652834 /ORGANISM="Palpitomonas bilix" /LENGTH=135 /DNA_ID=CAMNT_0000865685 /DNA_START=141 /DNA_END=548 /DNA_ORIENTATION=+ /assembly_acc=CAM_ASM_000599
MTTYLENFKVGDIVDVKANAAVQAGMPFKFYHGRTGRVWNVTKRAVGVEVNKTVKTGRIIPKRFHIRVEHVKHSNCRKNFVARCQENEKKMKEAKAAGKKVSLKREPLGPREAYIMERGESELVNVSASPHEDNF